MMLSLFTIAARLAGACAALLCLAGTPASATTVSAGYSHSCGVSSAGAPVCWGSLRLLPGEGLPGLQGQQPVDIQAGRDFSCALLKTGAVSCWGKNDFSQLGTAAGAPPGQTVGGLPGPVRQVAVGERHACALTQAADVYCWGDASLGQLGLPATGASAVAAKVPGLTGAVQIAAAKAATCAVLNNGSVACVGSGSLLSGADTDPTAARTVPGIVDANSIAIHEGHGCVVRMGGQVACWGRNVNGELGTAASNSFTATPSEVPGLRGPAQAIAAGDGFSCALMQSGAIMCWGKSGKGQLGTGVPSAPSQPPLPVVGIIDARAVSAGAEHVCAVLDGGYVNCWGSGANGRLGIPSCDTTTADYPGFSYTKQSALTNSAVCMATATGAITPYNVYSLGPNRDIELVLKWANQAAPVAFPTVVDISELFDNIQNFWLSDYGNGRRLAVNVNGTPKLMFQGPESGNAIVDLGPLVHWAREARK